MLKFDDVYTAYDFVSFDGGGNEAYLSQEQGRVALMFEEFPEITEEELETGDWIAVPNKRDLDLGIRLVFRFAEEYLAEYDWWKVEKMFSKRGAYANWKYFLDERGLLQKWYDYSNQAEIQALKEWLDLEQITYEDDKGNIITPSVRSIYCEEEDEEN